MGITEKATIETDEAYNVKGYKNRFGKKEYTKDERQLTSKNGSSLGITTKKASIVVRYVELIHALQIHFHKVPTVKETLEVNG